MFRNTLLIACITSVLVSCSHHPSMSKITNIYTGKAANITCSIADTNSVKTELYFGLSKKNGSTVTKAEWADFFSSVLVPKFGGLTILSTQGAWLDDETEAVQTENSKLVIILQRQEKDYWETIQEVVDVYVSKFDQQSVLVNSYPSNQRFCGKKKLEKF